VKAGNQLGRDGAGGINAVDTGPLPCGRGSDKTPHARANCGREPLWDNERLTTPHHLPDKSQRVRGMFDAIAPTYELVNTLFSGGRDHAWRRKAVKSAGITAGDTVLDVACGTGDFARTFHHHCPPPRLIVGCDFAPAMLCRAQSRTGPHMQWVRGDALSLPFPDASFTVVSCAFGIRNFQVLDAGLREMFRVLQPGGRAVILEFSRPRNRLWRAFYELYASRIMPLGAAWVSGDRTGAYRYLPRSVVSFPGNPELTERLIKAGFANVSSTALTFGIVTVYVARRAVHGEGIAG